jgi:ABC-type branched-subunit amino acid transport system substrate-binding protein
MVCGVLLVLVLVQFAYYLILYRPYAEVTCNPVGFLQAPAVLFPSALRAVKAPDGHCVGVSDGRFAFDMKRPDAQIKSDAAQAFRQGNIKEAQLKWQEALQVDTNDAEAGIYLQDQQVLSDPAQPYITFVVVTTLTGDDNAVNVGRDLLQGAYVAQSEYNEAQSEYNQSPRLPNHVRVVLLVANVSGASPDCPDTCANSVVDQLVEAANADQHIKGIIGWPAVSKGQESTALKTLADAGLPVISTTSSDWAGVPASFFHVAPTLEDQAKTAVHYATSHWQVKTAALFSDPDNAYSSTLANDFKQALVKAGGRLVYTGLYRVDHAGELKDSLHAGLLVHPDLIYFAGYSGDASDLIKQLRQLTTSPPPVMGGDALYRPGSYFPDALYRLENLYFTASAFPDVWGSFLQVVEGCKSGSFQPVFFCHYIHYFDPAEKHLNYPYGYMRPDGGVILAYDATLTFFSASSQLLSGDKTDFPLQALRQTLSQTQMQGISGLINFTSSTSKAVVVLRLRDGKNGFAGVPSQSIVGSFFCPSPIEVGMPCSCSILVLALVLRLNIERALSALRPIWWKASSPSSLIVLFEFPNVVI